MRRIFYEQDSIISSKLRLMVNRKIFLDSLILATALVGSPPRAGSKSGSRFESNLFRIKLMTSETEHSYPLPTSTTVSLWTIDLLGLYLRKSEALRSIQTTSSTCRKSRSALSYFVGSSDP